MYSSRMSYPAFLTICSLRTLLSSLRFLFCRVGVLRLSARFLPAKMSTPRLAAASAAAPAKRPKAFFASIQQARTAGYDRRHVVGDAEAELFLHCRPECRRSCRQAACHLVLVGRRRVAHQVVYEDG